MFHLAELCGGVGDKDGARHAVELEEDLAVGLLGLELAHRKQLDPETELETVRIRTDPN